MRLSQKLMTGEDAQLLEPLRQTMRLGVGEFAEGVFAWKGFLYYKWMLHHFAAAHAAFARQFSTCTIATDETRLRYEISKLRQSIPQRIELITMRAKEMIAGYDRAFAALVSGATHSFREFLIEAPEKFVVLGEGAGAINHIYALWGFRFPGKTPQRLDAIEAEELLQEFERMLGGVDIAGATPQFTVI